MGMRRKGRIVQYALIALVCLCVVFPFYWMINISMQKTTLNVYPPKLYPMKLDLGNYKTVWESDYKPLRLWLRNSLLVSLSSTGISLIFSLFAGYAISKYKFHGRDGFAFMILATQMLPAPLLLIPLYVIFREVGIIDSLFGLVVIDVALSIPLCVWMLKGFFDTLPNELQESAIIDGCTRMGVFYRIYVPLMKPGIAATAVFSFLLAWDEFFAANTITNTDSKWVAAVGLSTFIGERVVSWDQIMAAATIFCIPAIVFFLLIQRYLVSGLTAGSVKG
jgi:multiple sugar transport system permease protein